MSSSEIRKLINLVESVNNRAADDNKIYPINKQKNVYVTDVRVDGNVVTGKMFSTTALLHKTHLDLSDEEARFIKNFKVALGEDTRFTVSWGSSGARWTFCLPKE